MKKAIDKECMTAYFAVHHVSEFCFTEVGNISRGILSHSKLTLDEVLRKQKSLIHQVLVFLDKRTLLPLFRYSFEDCIPRFRHLSARKVELCKSIVGPGHLPEFL